MYGIKRSSLFSIHLLVYSGISVPLLLQHTCLLITGFFPSLGSNGQIIIAFSYRIAYFYTTTGNFGLVYQGFFLSMNIVDYYNSIQELRFYSWDKRRFFASPLVRKRFYFMKIVHGVRRCSLIECSSPYFWNVDQFLSILFKNFEQNHACDLPAYIRCVPVS